MTTTTHAVAAPVTIDDQSFLLTRVQPALSGLMGHRLRAKNRHVRVARSGWHSATSWRTSWQGRFSVIWRTRPGAGRSYVGNVRKFDKKGKTDMSESANTPTVVLVHGGFADASFWVPVIKDLQAHDLPANRAVAAISGCATS